MIYYFKKFIFILLIFAVVILFPKNLRAEEAISGKSLPLPHTSGFIQNQGQLGVNAHEVLYYLGSPGAQVFLTAHQMVWDLFKDHVEEETGLTLREGHVLRYSFVSGSPKEVQGLEPTGPLRNYIRGTRSQENFTQVPSWEKVLYKEVWPGIDIQFYAHNRQLKYDILLEPYARPEQIRLQITGSQGFRILSSGALVLHTSLGDFTEHIPEAWQLTPQGKVPVQVKYRLVDQTSISPDGSLVLGFDIPELQSGYPLVIDPIFVTYTGGSAGEAVADLDVDAAHNVYATGYTLSTNYPTTTGAYKTSNSGQRDVFVTKINAAGNQILYSTYIGGSADENGNGIKALADGSVLICGQTSSSNFPMHPEGFQKDYLGFDAFVLKLNPTGTALTAGTFYGGELNQSFSVVTMGLDVATDIDVDPLGNIYITGRSSSPDLPVTSGAFQTVWGGSATYQNAAFDAFVAKFNPGLTQLLYGTYLGGRFGDMGRAIKVSLGGQALIGGQTFSDNFPTTEGAYDRTFGGGDHVYGGGDAFLARFNAAGSGLVFSTYIGGTSNAQFGAGSSSDPDDGQTVGMDAEGNNYVGGTTRSRKFPTTEGCFQPTYGDGLEDGFVCKVKPDGTGLVWSSYLGGNYFSEGVYGLAVDSLNRVYVTGITWSENFPVTSEAWRKTHGGGSRDGYLTVFAADGSRLEYSTYLGGTGSDYGNALALGKDFTVWVGGIAGGGMPVTPGAAQPSNAGGDDGFITCMQLAPAIKGTDTLAFGSVNCQGPVFTQTLFVSNKGERTLQLKAGNITGPDAARFSIVQPASFPVLVPPRDSLPIRVKVNPQQAGPYVATLQLFSNDVFPYSDSLKSITLTALVDSFGVKSQVPLVEWAKISCGQTAETKSIKAQNTGNVACYIQARLSGPHSTAFEYSPDTPVWVLPQSSANFQVRFTPGSPGPSQARIIFETNPCTALDSAVLKGELESDYSITAYPPVLDFDPIHCQGQSVYKDTIIILKNNGALAVTLDKAQLSGNGFQVMSGFSSGIVLQPGDSIKVKIRFLAGSKGNYYGNVRFSVQECGLQTVHTLSGENNGGQVTIGTDSLLFGHLNCNGAQVVKKLGLKNQGIKGTNVVPTIQGSGASSYKFAPTTLYLGPGQSDTILVTYKPAYADTHMAQFVVHSDICGFQGQVPMKGSKDGYAHLIAQPSEMDFGLLTCADSAGFKKDTFKVFNYSSIPIKVGPPWLTGQGFELVQPLDSTALNPGDSVLCIIKFNPGGSGSFQGWFNIASPTCNVETHHSMKGSATQGAREWSISHSSIHFTQEPCPMERDSQFVFRNTGCLPITLKDPRTTNPKFSFVSAPVSVQIPPGGQITYNVHYSNTKPGLEQGKALLTMEATNLNLEVNLSASCDSVIGIGKRRIDHIHVYPNPGQTNQWIYLSIPYTPAMQILLWDVSGRRILLNTEADRAGTRALLPPLASGGYFLQVQDHNTLHTLPLRIAD